MSIGLIHRQLLIRKEGLVNRFTAYFIITLSTLLGGGSLLLFGAFLIRGPFTVIRFDASETQVLMWNGFLSLLFFIQHSGMVRIVSQSDLFLHPERLPPCNLFNPVRHCSHCRGPSLADIADGPLSDSRSALHAAPGDLPSGNRRFHMGSLCA